MSASEKLKALEADERWKSHDASILAGLALIFGDTFGGGILPQIRAVVEAAARYRNSRSQFVVQYAGEIPRYTEHEQAGIDFDAALAALDEALP